VLIEHILHRKGYQVETIAADAPVVDAVTRLRDRNIGALVVTSAEPPADGADRQGDAGLAEAGSTLAGILSERDIVRALAGAGDAAATLSQPVSALMSTELSTCRPEANVDDLMRLMTDRRIRHIPVLDEDGGLAGIVSIGDVVKSRIDELQTEADTLHEYLSSGR
jgi:CBS domain-containing protein